MYATSLRLPEDLGKRLNDLSRRTGRSKTFYILEAIREHLEEIEDVYIAEQRIAELRAGHSRIISSGEVEALLRVAN
ncbi:MAG: TraY domain-containing protein [Desulfovibrionaceae bacterium]|nr:TraY domain-containing protein [Desulfovibrionaceae bacterium]